MKEKGKNWIISLVAKTLEGALFGGLSKIQRKYSAVLDETPSAATKLFYLHAGLMFVVVVAAMGALALPAGTIFLVVELLSSSVNREVIAASILLMLLGACFLAGGAFAIYLIGKGIHSFFTRKAKELSRGH